MPELPEVETIKNGLIKKALGKPILKVEVNNESILRGGRKASFARALKGKNIGDIQRRGKMLIMEIDDENGKKTGKFLLVRLGMTGRLVHFDREDALWGGYSFKDKDSYAYKHCHFILRFAGGGVLLFCDSRMFGYLQIVGERGLKEKLQDFGPEPLEKDFTLRVLDNMMDGRKTSIKALLLNQKYIAGIGNIYADEILFDAGIRPTREASGLSAEERKMLYKSIKKVLRKAVQRRGTTFSDYVDASGNEGGYQRFLKVYGRAGKPCVGCRGEVQRIVVAGRGTNFCPSCQK
jgi:formamidopyrimidine-DNA glycosylase